MTTPREGEGCRPRDRRQKERHRPLDPRRRRPSATAPRSNRLRIISKTSRSRRRSRSPMQAMPTSRNGEQIRVQLEADDQNWASAQRHSFEIIVETGRRARRRRALKLDRIPPRVRRDTPDFRCTRQSRWARHFGADATGCVTSASMRRRRCGCERKRPTIRFLDVSFTGTPRFR